MKKVKNNIREVWEPLFVLIIVLFFAGYGLSNIGLRGAIDFLLYASLFLGFIIGIPVIGIIRVDHMRRSTHSSRALHISKIQKSFTNLTNILTQNNKNTYRGLDDILSKLYEIQEHIVKLEELRKSFNWDYRTILQFQKTFTSTFNYLIPIIRNLRSDLATRIAEQQQILEGAKSEVEQNLTGTPELLAVSEAQKVRLDRQIEQFEELQRVLVKV